LPIPLWDTDSLELALRRIEGVCAVTLEVGERGVEVQLGLRRGSNEAAVRRAAMAMLSSDRTGGTGISVLFFGHQARRSSRAG